MQTHSAKVLFMLFVIPIPNIRHHIWPFGFDPAGHSLGLVDSSINKFVVLLRSHCLSVHVEGRVQNVTLRVHPVEPASAHAIPFNKMLMKVRHCD